MLRCPRGRDDNNNNNNNVNKDNDNISKDNDNHRESVETIWWSNWEETKKRVEAGWMWENFVK